MLSALINSQIAVASESIQDAKEIMQDQLNIASINAQKTKLIHIKPPNSTDSNILIKFYDTNCLHNNNSNNDTCVVLIEVVTSYKYLGVYVDNKFKWNIHVDYLMLFHLLCISQ